MFVYEIAIKDLNIHKTFLYKSNFKLKKGERVLIRFRDKKTVGFVVNESETVTGLELNQIIDRLDFESYLEEWRVDALYRLSKKYGGAVGKYFSLSFPPDFDEYFQLYVESQNILMNIPKMKYEDFKNTNKNWKKYVEDGLVRIYRDFSVKVPKPRKDEYASIVSEISKLTEAKLTSKQQAVVNYLLINGTSKVSTIVDDLQEFGVERPVLLSLKEKGILELKEHPDLPSYEDRIELSDEQKKVVESILNSPESSKHLLFGPTGSGKTEIYLSVMEEYLKQGSVLYLVPEISLTEQTVARVRKKFKEVKIGVFHSYLTKSKKVEEWANAVNGVTKILIGTRSAGFVPLKDLKLVIVDEEHDDSYYNHSDPYYDLREFLTHFPVKVIFGSATPSLEHYYLAKTGKMDFHVLTKRYHIQLPFVEVVDLRNEKLVSSSISEKLVNEIDLNLRNGKSSLIFVRRKGFSRVQCMICGYILKCDSCDVSLTYHKDSNILRCHQCGRSKRFESTCPNCGSSVFVDKGTGTEKVEKELVTLFPSAKISRFDTEVADEPEKIKETLEKLREGKIDILVGTKMITKGLDIYRIGLVGVVDIDALLSYPDFNAQLKTFQTLVQFIGRAGRKDLGKAIIQTRNSEHSVIKYATEQAVREYYEYELNLRKELLYPPFIDTVYITYSSPNMVLGEETSQKAAELLAQEGFNVLGPVEHPIFKVQNKYRYQILVKTNYVQDLIEKFQEIKQTLLGDWEVRVNPPSGV